VLHLAVLQGLADLIDWGKFLLTSQKGLCGSLRTTWLGFCCFFSRYSLLYRL